MRHSPEHTGYDANGNQTGSGYTTSTGNEQTASPGYTYTYDADGNMLTSTQTSTGSVWTYTYNFRNLMTGAVETNSDDTIIAQVTYTYDALDNRIGMDENGTQTWTLYDGSKPIMDFSAGGSLETRYLNGPTGQLVDAVLANEGAGGAIAWYLPDRLGTVRDLINNSGGIIDHVDYSAFGTVLDEAGSSEGDRMMGFAGMERDAITGLSLAVNRVQNPAVGRWTSQDPLGLAARDANLYRYVGNSPTAASDRDGDDWLDTWANLFPTLGAGENLIYPWLAPLIGNNNLAGASANQLALGTAVASTAIVCTAYGGFIVLTSSGSVSMYASPTYWFIRGGVYIPGVHITVQAVSNLQPGNTGFFDPTNGEYNGPWGNMPFNLPGPLPSDAWKIITLPARYPTKVLRPGKTAYSCITGALTSIGKAL